MVIVLLSSVGMRYDMLINYAALQQTQEEVPMSKKQAVPLSKMSIPLDLNLDFVYEGQCHRVSTNLEVMEAPAGTCTICKGAIKSRTSESQEWQGQQIASANVESIENLQGMFEVKREEFEFSMIKVLVESKLAGPNKKVVLCPDCCPSRINKLLED